MAAILVDAGPLIALIVRQDTHHAWSRQAFLPLPKPLLTTDAVLTDAMYFLGKWSGTIAQEALWQFINREALDVTSLTPADRRRMAELMRKYSDNPMDFADASLVAVAERLSLSKIFTIDRQDFSYYKLYGCKSFAIIGP